MAAAKDHKASKGKEKSPGKKVKAGDDVKKGKGTLKRKGKDKTEGPSLPDVASQKGSAQKDGPVHSSFLLASNKEFDRDLDSLFALSAKPVPVSSSPSVPTSNGVKASDPTSSVSQLPSSQPLSTATNKKRKAKEGAERNGGGPKKTKAEANADEAKGKKEELTDAAERAQDSLNVENTSSSDEDEGSLERQYERKLAKAGPFAEAKAAVDKGAGSSDESEEHTDGDEDDEDEEDEEENEEEEEEIDDDDEDEDDEEEEEGDDDDLTSAPPIHEALLQGKVKGAKKNSDTTSVRNAEGPAAEGGQFNGKKKSEMSEEERAEKDARTLFVGNLPVDAATSKTIKKELRRHLLSFAPSDASHPAQIESIRFRSIAFSVPTDLPPEVEEKAESKARRRAAAWREVAKEGKAVDEGWEGRRRRKAKEDGEEDEANSGPADGPSKGKVFLTAKQKRKVAYIQGDINSAAQSVNAYVVLAPSSQGPERSSTNGDEDEQGDGNKSSPKRRRVYPPSILAGFIAACADGKPFTPSGTSASTRHLRVDLVRPLQPAELVSAGLEDLAPLLGSVTASIKGRGGTATGGAGAVAEPRKTVFVGNLDFEAGDEELRNFFEKTVTEEMGKPPPASAAAAALPDTSSASVAFSVARWVRSVRIVRDRATQLGKGFAYVRFVDERCVEEVLAVAESDEVARESGELSRKGEKSRLKFRGRRLRITRCKVGGGGGGKAGAERKKEVSVGKGQAVVRGTNKADRKATSSSASAAFSRAPLPKGDPKLGARLANLSKEERRKAKASDPARQARRLAKKKQRMAMDKGGGARGDGGGDKGATKSRTRKSAMEVKAKAAKAAKKGAGSSKGKGKKGGKK